MHLQFVYPWMLYMLWLVLAIGLIWLIVYQRKENRMEKLLSRAMQKKLCPPSHPIRFYWQLILLVTGLLLTVIALARPQWGTREEKIFQRSRDLIIALDVSRSMLAQDVRPNRLQRAKTDIMDLIRELRGDSVALIVFRRKAIQICPLTTDYAYLEETLNDVTINSAPRGQTNIGDAIDKAIQTFGSDKGSHKAIILISDGEDLTGHAKTAAEKARKEGIAIFTVGLGDPKGANIPDAKRPDTSMTYRGEKVITRLDHNTMKAIAKITGGAYVPVGIANVKLGTLYRDHLSKLAARDIEESIQQRYIDRYQFFLFPALLAFLTAGILSRGRLAEGRKRRIEDGRQRTEVSGQRDTLHASRDTLEDRGGAKVTDYSPSTTCHVAASARRRISHQPLTILIMCCCVLLSAFADETNSVTMTDSPTTTNATQQIQPKTEHTINTINTISIPAGRRGARVAQKLYQNGKYRQSAEAYLNAGRDANEELRNNMIFNTGCALYKNGQYQSAIQKFSELAKHNKADTSAADYNLGCATYQLAEDTIGTASNRYSKSILPLLKRSGQAFQHALHANPEHKAARENLAVVANVLPKTRKQLKIQALMEKYGKSQPFQITDEMLKNQRDINKRLSQAISNSTPAKIKLLENLAASEKTNSDLLIPLTPILATAMSRQPDPQAPGQQVKQQQQIAALAQHLEAVRNVMHQAGEELRDLDGNAANSVMAAESGIYNIWKGTAPYAPLLRENIYRQTNTIDMTVSILPQATDEFRKTIQNQQDESLDLTDLFIKRFSQAVPPGGIPGSPQQTTPAGTNISTTVTNKPTMTAETRTKILNMAQQTKTYQTQASKTLANANLSDSLAKQQKSYKLLKEIEKLLPKNKNKQKQKQSKDKQKQNKDKQKQKQDQDNQKQDQQKKEEKKDEPKPDQQKHQPEPKPKEQPANQKQSKPDKKEMTPEQAKALLEKALQREKDHKKKKMMRSYIPMSPVDKDW